MNDDELTPVWRALSDPTRRTILDLLKEQPRTTGDLCNYFDVSRYAIMKHLSILEKAELLIIRRQGRERWNHLNAVPLQRIYERWLRPYEAEWASTLLQLKHHLETLKGNSETMADKAISTATLTDIHIEQNVTIHAAPEDVFKALTQDISLWWTAPYFHLGEAARRLVLEPKVGGRLFEDIGNNEGLLLATVMAIKSPIELRLMGPMGMGGGPVQGVVQLQLEAKEKSTLLKLSHRAIGDVNEETKNGYSAGWEQLLGKRLRNFVEQGTRYDASTGALLDSNA